MLSANGQIELGNLSVVTGGKNHSQIHQFAEDAVNKIIYVSEGASPEIKIQAQAFKKEIYAVIFDCILKAINDVERY
jgi:hypothetical protein